MKSLFQQRFDEFQQEASSFQKQYNQWAVTRAVLFLSFAVLAYFLYVNYDVLFLLIFLLVAIGIFLGTVVKHLAIKEKRDKARLLASLNQDEINRLESVFTRPETGLNFANNQHFYTADLDIFGKHSIYQLLNRTHTYVGAKELASWLQETVETTTILERQEAIETLKAKIDWRQNFEVSAMMIEEVAEPVDKLLAWNNSPANTKIQEPLFQYGKYLAFVTVPLLLTWMVGLLPIGWVIVALGINGMILKGVFEEIGRVLAQTSQVEGALKAYSQLADLITKEDFENQALKNLQVQVAGASEAILNLDKITGRMANRTNPFFMFFVGLPTLWDIWYFNKLENWKASHQQDLPQWLATIAQFEALNSLAGYAFANPSFVVPHIQEEGILLKANALGHPMIRSTKRVCNDIDLEGIGKTIIITGSNMSGKSTFQRTVAINAVLALAGAVVCADEFECSRMQVFTSMRTQDSLEEDTSSFYAELKRLEQLLIRVKEEGRIPTLYFLDEILKGTNSKDRHDGAKALMLQLHKANASGFISTHDVELGDEFASQGFVENVSFASEVQEGRLVFDYKIKQGVCHSFNASQLMRQIGIEM
jgi:tetratricopeptide (TPR) repeat protein